MIWPPGLPPKLKIASPPWTPAVPHFVSTHSFLARGRQNATESSAGKRGALASQSVSGLIQTRDKLLP